MKQMFEDERKYTQKNQQCTGDSPLMTFQEMRVEPLNAPPTQIDQQ